MKLRLQTSVDIEIPNRDKARTLDVVDALVIFVEPAWRSRQGFAAEVEVPFEARIANCPAPFGRTRDDTLSDRPE